jgi:beige protein homolog 1
MPQCAKISDVTGNIVVCRGSRITLYTLNGSLLLEQAVGETVNDRILSCAFYEGNRNEWLERELLFTGHKRGLVNVSIDMLRRSCQMMEILSNLFVKFADLEQSDTRWTFRA